jgi:hypothetical protein
MSTDGEIRFEVGGRYRNRLGWYQVLDINGTDLKVRYEDDGREDNLPIELQKRIILNISIEESSVTPYTDEDKNKQFFVTMGYLSNNSFIEAIIPPKSQNGFDITFHRIKGRHPDAESEEGYYVHHDSNVDKWGVEMRLTFEIPKKISLNQLDFGSSVRIVESPDYDKKRINNNGLCWKLLSFGFELGARHNLDAIESKVPERYRENYQEGRKLS